MWEAFPQQQDVLIFQQRHCKDVMGCISLEAVVLVETNNYPNYYFGWYQQATVFLNSSLIESLTFDSLHYKTVDFIGNEC